VDGLAIETEQLRKRYGAFEAVRGVDLAIPHGEVFALLGPNGAGKTTTVEILEGYRQRTDGRAVVLGADPATAGGAWRARIGIVLQSTGVFDALTVEEVVRHFASFYPKPLSIDHVIAITGLQEKRRARCKSLSGGQKRRVDLALGLVGDPELIFLDEPTTGFDPAARRQSWDVVREFTRLGKTVLLTTHYMDEAEHLADRVAVIVGGRLIEVGTPREIGGRARDVAQVTFRAEGALAGSALPAVAGTVEAGPPLVRIATGEPTHVVAALTEWARAAGVAELPELAVTRPSLEDVYLRLIAEHAEPGTEVAA
jgi:ABC-2 type transport system ATP-binding protein